mmetsp:Transcript_41928/g.106145  ORF Transcript_41928/g.106145 Transcript_41928/m.106145 type:complete len:404 (+) Transcript_41928:223-1434(+)
MRTRRWRTHSECSHHSGAAHGPDELWLRRWGSRGDWGWMRSECHSQTKKVYMGRLAPSLLDVNGGRPVGLQEPALQRELQGNGGKAKREDAVARQQSSLGHQLLGQLPACFRLQGVSDGQAPHQAKRCDHAALELGVAKVLAQRVAVHDAQEEAGPRDGERGQHRHGGVVAVGSGEGQRGGGAGRGGDDGGLDGLGLLRFLGEGLPPLCLHARRLQAVRLRLQQRRLCHLHLGVRLGRRDGLRLLHLLQPSLKHLRLHRILQLLPGRLCLRHPQARRLDALDALLCGRLLLQHLGSDLFHVQMRHQVLCLEGGLPVPVQAVSLAAVLVGRRIEPTSARVSFHHPGDTCSLRAATAEWRPRCHVQQPRHGGGVEHGWHSIGGGTTREKLCSLSSRHCTRTRQRL